MGSGPSQIGRHQQGARPVLGDGLGQRGRDRRSGAARQGRGYEHQLGLARELHGEGPCELFERARRRPAPTLHASGRDGRDDGRGREPAELPGPGQARRELAEGKGREHGEEDGCEEGEHCVADRSRRARCARSSCRLGQNEIRPDPGAPDAELAQLLANDTALCGAGRLIQGTQELRPGTREPPPLGGGIHGQERARDGVRDRRGTLGVGVGRVDVDEVRVLVDRRADLVLERLGRLVAQARCRPREDFPRQEELANRGETPLHRLDVTRLEPTGSVVHHDPRLRLEDVGYERREHEHRRRHGDDDGCDQEARTPESGQVTRNFDRLGIPARVGRRPTRARRSHEMEFPRGGPSETSKRRRRALLVSSFVRPHAGGVEEFVESARELLEQQGWEVRVLACRLPGDETSAHAVVPARLLGATRWPLPTGGWRTIWDEVAAADVVIANNARHLLSVLAAVSARLSRRPVLLVIHGSGEGHYAGTRLPGLLRELFQRTLGRLAVDLARPISVSRVGVRGTQELYGVETGYLPYPLRELPPATPPPSSADVFRVVWVGRLSPEKDPVLAVRAVEALQRRTDAELAMYGDGPLRAELDALARDRPWLSVLGTRPWPEVLEAQGKRARVSLDLGRRQRPGRARSKHSRAASPRCPLASAMRPRTTPPPLTRFCVVPGDAGQIAAALGALAAEYDTCREEFAENAVSLRRRHARAPGELAALVQSAVTRGRSRR